MEITAWIISSTCLFLVSLTMIARANDLRWRKGIHWNARLVGFILVGLACVGIIGHEFIDKDWPSLYEVLFRVGLMLVFVTTPYLPPWWKWISGYDSRQTEGSGWGDTP
jgi:hypothetical protein